MLIKNVYVKCKIIDLHINQQLLSAIAYFNKLAKFL
jgi:hypothetical protein